MNTFAEGVIRFHLSLTPDWVIPRQYELLFPFGANDTREAFTAFYHKYYSDTQERHFIFGINPGRFGAGITGVPFTDPIRLESVAGISNPFEKKSELSSIFIYQVIEALQGLTAFTQAYYITSLCPLGFVKAGKNFNYYDDKHLADAVKPHIIDNINRQIEFGARRDKAFSLGMGKNVQYFTKLNEEHGWFKRVIPLPHPRWVMQYRRKQLDQFIAVFKNEWPT